MGIQRVEVISEPASEGCEVIRGGVEVAAGGRADDYVELWRSGANAKGEFQCSGCGYGVTIYTKLPVCPMCGGESWEQTAWSPFGRGGSLAPL
jgi:hypothetical protein